MKRKIVAVLLSLSLSLGLIGVQPCTLSAYAEETSYEEIQLVEADEVEVLIKNTFKSEEVREALNHAFIANIDQVDPEELANISWEYECEGKSSGIGLAKNTAWGSIDGFTSTKKVGFANVTYNHPALKDNSDSTYSVRIAGSNTVKKVKKIAARTSSINLKTNNATIGLMYTADGSYDYQAMTNAIYNELIESTIPENALDRATLEYNAKFLGFVDSYKTFDSSLDLSKVEKEGSISLELLITFPGDEEYTSTSTKANITIEDRRIASDIKYVEGASFTYNSDATTMKQEILNRVIDWSNSTLPEKSSVSIDDFTFEYYAAVTADIAGTSLPTSDKSYHVWSDIAGSTTTIPVINVSVVVPKMGCDEQKIRISYKGNNEYKPLKNAEASVKVNKAKTKAKIKLSSIYAGEKLPENYITIEETVDKFDVYTVFTGVTTNLNPQIYVQLPEKYSNSNIMKLLNPAFKQVTGKDLETILNEGTSVGEIKKFFGSTIVENETFRTIIIEAFKLADINLETIFDVIDVVNKLPGIADNVRIAFGTPSNAGTYVATAIAVNKNYEPATASSALLVKINLKNVKLEWNAALPSTLTVAQAKEFDFGATLTYNGEKVADQSNVKYLYTGLTSKFKPYASSKAPTEAGSYIMTVSTIGGNYLAAPITRTFKIKK